MGSLKQSTIIKRLIDRIFIKIRQTKEVRWGNEH